MKKIKLIIEGGDGPKKVAHVTFNSKRNLNAIDLDFYEELTKSLDIITDRDDIGVLVLSSMVSNAFSAGVDVAYVQALTNEEASQFFNRLSELLDRLARFPLPTIANVNGYALGAGADLALACDIRIAASSAVFRFPGPQFGLILGTQRLINEIGESKARFLTLTNQKVTAKTALQYGLVHEVCEDQSGADMVILNRIRSLQRVPGNTVQTLKELCDHPQEGPSDLTRKSVSYGDFGQRFSEYTKK